MTIVEKLPTPQPQVAIIDEDACIGCTKCIQACPVDAIIGAAKSMHTVIGAECIGCGLCLPPCPVDCILLTAIAPLSPAQQDCKVKHAQQRFSARNERLTRRQPHIAKQRRAQVTITLDDVQAAVARAMARKSHESKKTH